MSLGQRVRLRFGPSVPLSETLFAAISAQNAELRLERTQRGDLEINAPAGAEGSRKNAMLLSRLRQWAEGEGRGLGEVFDSSAGFVLQNGAIRSPDASWIRKPRWEALTREEQAGFAPLCPDFVIELRSATDRLPLLRKKMAEYLAQGARLGWLIDPITGTLEIDRPGRDVETLDRPSTLSGENVLPSFVLDLDEIMT